MHHHVRLKLLTAAIGLAAFSAAGAATVHRFNAEPLAAAPANHLTAALGLGVNSQLEARFSQPTRHGTRTVRMQQMYRGVPVYGRSVAVELDSNGAAIRASGAVERGIGADLGTVKPKLSSHQVQGLLRLHQGNMAWLHANQSIYNRQTTLYVYPDDQRGAARLVYLTSYVVTDAGGKTSRPTALIDANTGKILKEWDGLTHADYDANGPGGNQKTGEYYWGQNGLPALKATSNDGGVTCSLSNSDVKTYNLNHASSGTGTLITFNCPTQSGGAINGAFSPGNDAHHFGQVVHDMYQAWFGAPPLNQVLIMKVHLKTNYENAYWDGTAMNFGDGGSTMYPLVALDVTGHEISHGFTEQHSNLAYSGQSGGMNEAFSDMAGEAAEYYDRGSNDFLVGADIIKNGTALRWMCTPTSDGGSIDNAADYYNGLDVHYSSGVYNKAFCTLAKTSGWNTKSAFEVFERANALYWQSDATFDTGACGVESAATDLGMDKNDVVAAFNAVGVACATSGGGGGSTTSGGGTLNNGVAVTDVAVAANDWTGTYTVTVPAGASNLVIQMSGGSGDADMYVKFGADPTSSSYDCRPYKSGNSESCSFASPSAGVYHVKLNGYQAASGITLKATWSTGGGGGGGNTGGGALENGVAQTGISVGASSWSDTYTVTIPSGASNLVIAMSGGSGDADLYVKLGADPTSSSYDCRPYKYGNNETCTFATPSAGVYHVKLNGYQASSGISLKATWDTGSGGGGNGGSGYYDNSTNTNVPDHGSVTSTLAVSGENSAGDANLKVHVSVVHSYRGDVRITLIAPDGSSVVLKDSDGSDGAANVNQTWTVNASGVNPNGTWKLKVEDVYYGDTGYLDDWSLQF